MPEKTRRHSAACTKLRLSDVACYAWLSSRSWSCERSLRELPDREDDTEDKGHKNCNVENAATFLLRPHYQTVGRFELVVRGIVGFHNIGIVACGVPPSGLGCKSMSIKTLVHISTANAERDSFRAWDAPFRFWDDRRRIIAYSLNRTLELGLSLSSRS